MIDVPEILDDGTPFADLQAAIQAAWIAGARRVAAELSKRYGLYNKLCLRCACPSLSVFAWANRSPGCMPDSYLARLCQPCQHEELRPAIKPIVIIDSIDSVGLFQLEQRVNKPFDLKPLLDQLKAKLDKIPEIKFEFTTFRTK